MGNPEQNRNYYLANRDRLRSEMRVYYRDHREEQRNYRRQRKFGVSPERFQEMVKNQKGLCAICGRPERRIRDGRITTLAVDHCSKGGHVRGLLCAGCNTGLGLFGHSEKMLEKALKYMRSEVLFNQQ